MCHASLFFANVALAEPPSVNYTIECITRRMLCK